MIDWAKCFSVCTDGTPGIMECWKGFVDHVKRINPSVQVIHCVLHRKNLALFVAIKDVIEIVNFVITRATKSRLF